METSQAIIALDKVIKKAETINTLDEKRAFVIQVKSIVQSIFGINSVELLGLSVFSDATYGISSIDDVYTDIVKSYVETLKSYIDTLKIMGIKKEEAVVIEKPVKNNWFSHYNNIQIFFGIATIYGLGAGTVKFIYEIIDRSQKSTISIPLPINPDNISDSKTARYIDSGKDSAKYNKVINDSIPNK